VLDEDEFANTLIPELFKHNNYASFVRQLNMYGFHKKVGLSDNSMNASANKRKTPSEYYNKYFKRGRPELLWLIQKPKNPPGNAKRKRGDTKAGAADSDDEAKPVVERQPSETVAESTTARQDLATIPKAELSTFRHEVEQLKQQQRYISSIISQMKRQNDQLYQQAQAFSAMHDRHESSINAILTFLSSFYNRSLEGQGVNIQDMFNNVMPQNMQQQQHGNVVDVGDYPEADVQPQPQRPIRRPFLLEAPPANVAPVTPVSDKVSTAPPSARSTMSPKPGKQNNFPFRRPSQTSQANNRNPVFKTDAPTPDTLSQVPEKPSSGASRIAPNSGNASSPNTGNADFDTALSQIDENVRNSGPLTPQQREQVLSLMNSTSGAGSNNALATSTPPQLPNLDDIGRQSNNLDFLQKLQEEQAGRVQQLADRLTPLSPTGSIPGFTVNGGELGNPGELDLNDWMNTDYFGNTGPNPAPNGFTNDLGNDDLFGDLPNFDGTADATNTNFLHVPTGTGDDNMFNLAGTADGGHVGGRVESVSSEATSPAATVPDEAKESSNAPDRSPKKRRKN